MRRLAALFAIPVLAGLPLWIAPSWMVGVLAAAGAAFCLAGARRASLQAATTGGVLTLIALTLAVRNAAAAPHVLVMLAYGLALLLLVDSVQFCSRFGGPAEIARGWWRRHLTWWGARAAICLAAGIVIAGLAPLMAMAVPPFTGAFLAGAGVLMAFAAALMFARPDSGE
jgi:hypothetical protein